MDEIALKNPLALAFLGDAVIKQWVSRILVENTSVDLNTLHRRAASIVCARNQSELYEKIKPTLTEVEENIASRAFNAKHKTTPKNCTLKEYRGATALEALIAYHSLRGNEARLNEILGDIVPC